MTNKSQQVIDAVIKYDSIKVTSTPEAVIFNELLSIEQSGKIKIFNPYDMSIEFFTEIEDVISLIKRTYKID